MHHRHVLQLPVDALYGMSPPFTCRVTQRPVRTPASPTAQTHFVVSPSGSLAYQGVVWGHDQSRPLATISYQLTIPLIGDPHVCSLFTHLNRRSNLLSDLVQSWMAG